MIALWLAYFLHIKQRKTAGLQVIDLENRSLQNVIEFPPEGAFIVQSDIGVESDKINVPPRGKGWFDTVYMDDEIRVATDIRGDTLVVARDGPPRVFG